MQGMQMFARARWGLLAWLLVMAGCSHLPELAAVPPVNLAPAQATAVTLALGDLPSDYRLAQDLTPADGDLAALLGPPALAGTLAQAHRLGGSYRVFTFTAPEPGVFNATVRATVELDVFDSATHASGWEAALQAHASGLGAPLTVAAPGQAHHARLQSFHAGDFAATTTLLTLVEGNTVLAITTDFVGPNVSLADAERFASIIDGRIKTASG